MPEQATLIYSERRQIVGFLGLGPGRVVKLIIKELSGWLKYPVSYWDTAYLCTFIRTHQTVI